MSFTFKDYLIEMVGAEDEKDAEIRVVDPKKNHMQQARDQQKVDAGDKNAIMRRRQLIMKAKRDNPQARVALQQKEEELKKKEENARQVGM